jgi:hypothetical protein
MAKMYLDHDLASGVSHWTDTDEETGITRYGYDQDVTSILDWNKREYNEAPTRWGEWSWVGSIPLALYWQWQQEGILDDQEELKKRLNDIDFRSLRTRPGTL